MSTAEFYDGLAPLYHLIFEDWEATVARQGAQLAALIAEHWGGDARSVHDAAVGIGTQSRGLLARGCRVTATDLSAAAVARARGEAARRGLRLPCAVADFRAVPVRSESVDVVLVADNALPHLDSEAEIRGALEDWRRCARPGGGCLVTMRDYGAPPPPGTVQVRPYGERVWAGRRYHVQQTWTWRGPGYDVALEIAPVDAATAEPVRTFTASYLAIAPARVAALMSEAGFSGARRIDDRFFQPVLVGTRPR